MIKPFLAFGSNALIAYFVAGLFGRFTSAKFLEYNNTIYSIREFMFSEVFSTFLNPYNASFAYSIANTSLIFVLIWWLYRKHIIIKV